MSHAALLMPKLCNRVGLFLAPQMVGEALKGGRLVAAVMASAGIEAVPAPGPVQQHAFITAVKLGSAERLLAFCGAVQRCSPVGAFVEPVPGLPPWLAWATRGSQGESRSSRRWCRAFGINLVMHGAPSRSCVEATWARRPPVMHCSNTAVRDAGATAGYSDEVVFANGTFIDGSTSELSADGPLRPPYAVYCQVRPRSRTLHVYQSLSNQRWRVRCCCFCKCGTCSGV